MQYENAPLIGKNENIIKDLENESEICSMWFIKHNENYPENATYLSTKSDIDLQFQLFDGQKILIGYTQLSIFT